MTTSPIPHTQKLPKQQFAEFKMYKRRLARLFLHWRSLEGAKPQCRAVARSSERVVRLKLKSNPNIN